MICLLALTLLVAVPNEAVVARVGPQSITARQVRERAALTRQAGGTAVAGPLVQDLINDQLMADEALRQSLDEAPAVKARVAAEVRKLAAARLVEKEITGAVKVQDADLLRMYHETGDSLAMQMVVLSSEAEVQAAMGRLAKGGKLADEAKNSLDPDIASRGGEFGTRVRGQLAPELAEAAFKAPLNQVTGPVKLELGYALIRVTQRQLAPEAEFAAKKEAIRGFAEQQGRGQYKLHYVMQLRKASKVKVDEAFIKSTGIRTTATPAELEHPVAVVGGQTIRYQVVLDQLRYLFNGQEGGHASGASVKTELAWGQVDQALLEQAALERHLDADPQVRAGAQAALRDAAARELANRLRSSAPAPVAADIAGFYQGHPEQFSVPAHRDCAHLLVQDREQAESLRKRNVLGESFEALAEAYSRDSASAPHGGALGSLTHAQMDAVARQEPALGEALRHSPALKVSEPVQSRAGWHLVRCGAEVAAVPVPLAKVQEAIAANLTRERGDDRIRQEIARLRSGTTIQVDTALTEQLNQATPVNVQGVHP